MKRARYLPLPALAAALCLSCTTGTPAETQAGEHDPLDLERMKRQERADIYEPSTIFEDGLVMRHPPEGAVASDSIAGNPGLTSGLVGGAYVERFPVPVTLDLLRAGRDRFDIFCSPCHGVAGDGESHVARVMTLRRPPSLVDPRVQAFPPGRVYQVIVEGYGLMRSYEAYIPLTDRWAIVAYVQALGKRRGVPLDALPPPLRDRARKELP